MSLHILSGRHECWRGTLQVALHAYVPSEMRARMVGEGPALHAVPSRHHKTARLVFVFRFEFFEARFADAGISQHWPKSTS
mmetsp:Transcript_9678/g.17994  ORF Transcript_9678/g.17994 Transcript_9678/m.17994 type:complete len:81 (+) Transcript_9678:85-327(+)